MENVSAPLCELSTKKLASRRKNLHVQRRYPWGDEADPNRANYSDTGIGATNTVGCFANGASPYGCEEMSGNVWEWTRSLWGDAYPYPADEKKRAARENLEASADVRRVLRGGAFSYDVRYVRCALRYWFSPYYRGDYVGFRLSAARPLL